MNDKVGIFKFFWPDQDEAQERWLRQMASEGLHLASVNLFCRWTFVRGAKADVAYRVDFPATRDVHFNQLLEDAGWEHAAELGGWHYWRKPVEAGLAPEIFTDAASKVQKFKTVLATLALLVLPVLMMLSGGHRDSFLSGLSAPTRWGLVVLLSLHLPLMLYAMLRLWRRIYAP